MKNKTLSWNAFEKEFKPLQNHLDNNASLNGSMYETYGEELEHIKKVYENNPTVIWTYVSTDEGKILINGLAFVNRIGYLVTEKCFDDNFFIEVVDD